MKAVIFSILFMASTLAFSQTWQWAHRAGGNDWLGYDAGFAITDGSNHYLCGEFSSTMFMQTNTLNARGESDFFIVKYDDDGHELWAKSFGGYNGQNESEVMWCVYDSTHHCIYVSGIFAGQMILGGDTIHATDRHRNFLAKMDLDGNFVWAKNVWTRTSADIWGRERGPWLYLQPNGVLTIFTNLLDSAYFDGLPVAGGGCMAKLDSDGKCFSVRHLFDFAGISGQGGIGVGFLENDIVFAGCFQQTFRLDTATLHSNGDYDMVLARSDSSGNLKWIRHYGYGGYDYMRSVAVSPDGYIYTIGGFEDSISVGGNTLYSPVNDFVLMKFDANGNSIFVKQGHSITSVPDPGNLAFDKWGNFYVFGSFDGSMRLDNFHFTVNNSREAFLARFDTSGTCLGVSHFGNGRASYLTLNNAGFPIVAGIFSDTLTMGNETFVSSGPFDIYIAKSDIIAGVKEAERQATPELSIYANPNAGKCTLVIPDEFLHDKSLTLSIYSHEGKLIQQKPVHLSEEKISINLEAEARGVYRVTLSNGRKAYHGKIILE